MADPKFKSKYDALIRFGRWLIPVIARAAGSLPRTGLFAAKAPRLAGGRHGRGIRITRGGRHAPQRHDTIIYTSRAQR